MASLYEELGGEDRLRTIIEDFVDRVFADVMIGFFFRNATPKRIKELEFQLAAQHLGGPFEYKGRSMMVAHSKHPIMGGHFDRRREILRQTLEDHGVPPAVRDAWLAHTDSLRGQITKDPLGRCDD